MLRSTSCYDLSGYALLGISSKQPAANPVFHEWRTLIERCLIVRCTQELAREMSSEGRVKPDDVHNYRVGQHKKLYNACITHELRNRKQTIAQDVVVLVHPLYLLLSHQQYLRAHQRTDMSIFLHQLSQLFATRDKKTLSIVALDTIYHYAAATSVLLEQGKIDQVIFTQGDSGRVMDHSQLKGLEKRFLYVAGGYFHTQEKMCVNESLEELENVSDTVHPIRDLILESPRLTMNQILCGDQSHSLPRARSLEAILEIMQPVA